MSIHRLKEAERLLNLIKLKNFDIQNRLIDALYRSQKCEVGMVVFDTITEPYRAHIAEARDPLVASKLLNRHLAMLSDLSDRFGLKVVLTCRARKLAEDLEPEASSLLEYWSNIIVKIERLGTRRRLIVEKGPLSLEELVIEAEMLEGGLT